MKTQDKPRLSPELLAWMIAKLDQEEQRATWKELPDYFEAGAVAALLVQLNPYFHRHQIRQRIAASKALTFAELEAAIRSMA